MEPKEQREQNNSCVDCAESRVRKDAVQLAYAFFHQKQRIYQYSTLDWQKDDIEYAIEDYVSQMDKELYNLIFQRAVRLSAQPFRFCRGYTRCS